MIFSFSTSPSPHPRGLESPPREFEGSPRGLESPPRGPPRLDLRPRARGAGTRLSRAHTTTTTTKKKTLKIAAAAAASAEAAAAFAAAREADPLKDLYGDLPLIQSSERSRRTWRDVRSLSAAEAGSTVLVRARVDTVRGGGKSCFMVLRQRTSTIQLVVMADESGERCSRTMVKFAATLTKESVVDVEAEIAVPEKPVESCSVSSFELRCVSIKCVSRAGPLPFDVADAARSEAEVAAAAAEGKLLATVSQDTRLDGRVLDLRVPASQAIFSVQSAVGALFREAMAREGFMEIHSPCLIAGASEGGAACFALDYMGRPACLAQSPQLYKQMALMVRESWRVSKEGERERERENERAGKKKGKNSLFCFSTSSPPKKKPPNLIRETLAASSRSRPSSAPRSPSLTAT